MEDTNLYDEIILNFKKEKELNEQLVVEKYNESINSFCDNLYSIIFNPKLKSIIKFNSGTEILGEKIKITDENDLIYRKFIYIEQDQNFILVFNSLNLDKIFEIYKDHKDAFISDILNEFNKRYKKFKIQIYKFDIYEEREYDKLNDNISLEPIPNLYRYRIILNHLSGNDEYMKLEKERNLENEWKKKHPILSSFLNYHSR